MGKGRESVDIVAGVLWSTLVRTACRLLSSHGGRGFDAEDVAGECIQRILSRLDQGTLGAALSMEEGELESLVLRAISAMEQPVRQERQARKRSACQRLHLGEEAGAEPGEETFAGLPPGAAADGTAEREVSDGQSARAELERRLEGLRPPPTQGQLEVLRLLAGGATLRGVARHLERDPSSVRERLRRIFRRLQGVGGAPSLRLDLPRASPGFFRDRPPRWRRVYLAVMRGQSRDSIATKERLSAKALQALIRRLRRALAGAAP